MDNFITALNSLRPVDLSILMFVVMIIDMWTAIIRAVKNRAVLSKTLIKGCLTNLLLILVPLMLEAVSYYLPPTSKTFDYIQVLSVFVATIYVIGSATSIISNYSAAYPQTKNFITEFAYRYLSSEVADKQRKQGIVQSGDVNNEQRGS